MWKVLHWYFLGRVASPFMHVPASLLMSAASLRRQEKLSRRDIVPSLALCLTYCAFHLDPNSGHFAFAPWWTVSIVGLREKEVAILVGSILVGLLFVFSQTMRVMAHVAINLASLSNGKMSTKARALVHFLCAFIFARETDGYYADTSKTYIIGKPGADAYKLVKITRECLQAGMDMVHPGNRVGDIGWAIQEHAESNGCSVVREFVGHGVGFDFHEAPQIPHYGQKGKGIVLVPGMVFTIEPMINLGKKDLHILADNWTAVTNDGSLSAQFEQTILVTENGYESLTPYDLHEPLPNT